MKALSIICLFYSLSFGYVCCGQVSKKDEMTRTIKVLMQKLLSNDSIGVLYLHEKISLEDPVTREMIASQCVLFQKVVKKYGTPSIDNLVFTKEDNGTNRVSIVLMDQKDSELKIKRSELVVWFYADQFLTNPSKFSNFIVTKEPFNLESPTIPRPNN